MENSAARSLGTRYPFIQGAMTWISDALEFALAVSEAGGLPTIALGPQKPYGFGGRTWMDLRTSWAKILMR